MTMPNETVTPAAVAGLIHNMRNWEGDGELDPADLIEDAASALEALSAENERLRKALEPFAAVAEHDIGGDETDDDIFWPFSNARYSMSGRLRVGHLRAARRALEGGE